MEIEELYKACASQKKMPMVKSYVPIKYAKSNFGKVEVIKDGDSHFGCAVRFEGMNHCTWFYAKAQYDKRKKDMSQLILV